VGTLDLDLGLAFALVGEQRYQSVAERLRAAGFQMDKRMKMVSPPASAGASVSRP